MAYAGFCQGVVVTHENGWRIQLFGMGEEEGAPILDYPGGTGIAGFVIKLGKVVCVSRVYRYSISLRI